MMKTLIIIFLAIAFVSLQGVIPVHAQWEDIDMNGAHSFRLKHGSCFEAFATLQRQGFPAGVESIEPSTEYNHLLVKASRAGMTQIRSALSLIDAPTEDVKVRIQDIYIPPGQLSNLGFEALKRIGSKYGLSEIEGRAVTAVLLDDLKKGLIHSTPGPLLTMTEGVETTLARKRPVLFPIRTYWDTKPPEGMLSMTLKITPTIRWPDQAIFEVYQGARREDPNDKIQNDIWNIKETTWAINQETFTLACLQEESYNNQKGDNLATVHEGGVFHEGIDHFILGTVTCQDKSAEVSKAYLTADAPDGPRADQTGVDIFSVDVPSSAVTAFLTILGTPQNGTSLPPKVFQTSQLTDLLNDNSRKQWPRRGGFSQLITDGEETPFLEAADFGASPDAPEKPRILLTLKAQKIVSGGVTFHAAIQGVTAAGFVVSGDARSPEKVPFIAVDYQLSASRTVLLDSRRISSDAIVRLFFASVSNVMHP